MSERVSITEDGKEFQKKQCSRECLQGISFLVHDSLGGPCFNYFAPDFLGTGVPGVDEPKPMGGGHSNNKAPLRWRRGGSNDQWTHKPQAWALSIWQVQGVESGRLWLGSSQ